MNKEILKKINTSETRVKKLEKAVFGNGKRRKLKKGIKVDSRNIDFSLNERHFVKLYTTDKSGPKKFTILLAHLVKGEVRKSVELSKIKRSWNRMSAKNLLGKFNMFYPNDAKTRGWVDSQKYGSYCLQKKWTEVFN